MGFHVLSLFLRTLVYSVYRIAGQRACSPYFTRSNARWQGLARKPITTKHSLLAAVLRHLLNPQPVSNTANLSPKNPGLRSDIHNRADVLFGTNVCSILCDIIDGFEFSRRRKAYEAGDCPSDVFEAGNNGHPVLHFPNLYAGCEWCEYAAPMCPLTSLTKSHTSLHIRTQYVWRSCITTEDLKRPITANIIGRGAIVCLSQIVPRHAFVHAVEWRAPSGTTEKNLRALQAQQILAARIRRQHG